METAPGNQHNKPMKKIERIIILGAGNVATHLGNALSGAGKEILQVYSRTRLSASQLARQLNCSYTTNIKEINPSADLYIFSLADKAMVPCLKDFPHKNVFLVHTSGSLDINILQYYNCSKGVFYPLQTFSRQVSLDFSNIPVCIEADTPENIQVLCNLASEISNDVRIIDSGKRETLHLAAVFACNFTNHMFAIAQEVLQKEQVSFDILHPLIHETLQKAYQNNPKDVQTGPAKRNDNYIIKKHLQKLDGLPDYQKIYTFISESIIQFHKNINDTND